MTQVATEELAAELAGPLRPLTLIESAGVLGGLRYVELRLFTVLGRRAPIATPAEAALWAASASLAAVRRAGELAVLLPVSKGLPDADTLTRPPGNLAEAALADLEAAEAERTLVARTAHPLYAALAGAYGSRADAAAPAADAPAAAVLSRLAADVARQLEATEQTLRSTW